MRQRNAVACDAVTDAMRVGIDATPLLGVRSGVGRYVEHLSAALARIPDVELTATAFTLRGAHRLAVAVPGGVRARNRPVPARALQALWSRIELPPVEWLAGRVDVFHATNFVLPPLRKARGVVTIHDLAYLHSADTVSTASLRYQTLVPRSIRRAAVVCTPTQAVAQEVRAEYDAEHVVVTRLGVDDAWFETKPPDAQWKATHGLPSSYLLFVGTLEPRKNLPVLLDAYRALRAADPDTPPLVLVGATGWGPALADLDSVITPGYLEQDDLRKTVAGAVCLVLPARYEGFGIPVLEAFACGTPVVASDVPAIREVAGGHATLAPVGDVDALAEALTTVLDAEDTHAEVRRARAREWTWTRCAEETVAAYRLALS